MADLSTPPPSYDQLGHPQYSGQTQYGQPQQQYGAPQYGAPQYGAPQPGYPQPVYPPPAYPQPVYPPVGGVVTQQPGQVQTIQVQTVEQHQEQQQPAPIPFTSQPVEMTCPKCGSLVRSNVDMVVGNAAKMFMFMMCFMCCCFLAWIPLVSNSMKDAVHTCPNCHHELMRCPRARFTSGGRRRRRRGGMAGRRRRAGHRMGGGRHRRRGRRR